MKKVKEILIFFYGKNKKTRLIRILITLAVVAFILWVLLGFSIDLGFFKIEPVADIKINI